MKVSKEIIENLTNYQCEEFLTHFKAALSLIDDEKIKQHIKNEYKEVLEVVNKKLNNN